MRTVLVPIDGTEQAEAAVRRLIGEARSEAFRAIHLVNVQPDLGGYVGRFVGAGAIRRFKIEEGQKELAGARRLLEAAGLDHTAHIRVGDAASAIAALADETQADEIVVAGDAPGLLGRLMMRALVSRLLRLSNVPVRIVKPVAPAAAPVGAWRPA